MVPPPPQPENPALRTLKAVVFGLAGLCLIVAGVYCVVSTRDFLARARTAAGEVTLLRAGGAHPQVRFVTDEGQAVEYAQNGMIWGYRPGDRVTVLYDPREPTRDPVVDTPGALWGFDVMNFLMGVVFLLAAYQMRRPDPSVPPPLPR